MKIGIDAHVFDEKFQGSRTYLEGLYQEVIRLRPDWKFYFFAKNTSVLEETFGKWEHVEYVPLNSSNKYSRLLLEFPRLLKKFKIEYAHFQYIAPPFLSCDYFVTTHDILFLEPRFKKYFPWKYRFLNGLLFKRSAKKASWVLTVSDYSKEKICEYFQLKSESVYVTTNAVNEPQIQHKSDFIQNKYGIEKYLLYVSRVEPRKNHLALLKAFVNLKLYNRGYALVFIGSRDLPYPELDRFIQEHSELLEGKLLQYPGISGRDLEQFYANATAFVYPSLAEGFGIPPLEAAMSGAPVICSNATAMSEFSFFLHHVNPNHPEELENALEAVLNGDVDHPEHLKEQIRNRYSWKESAEQLVQSVEVFEERK